ncbi:unnamed protein product [Ilex paraguariensis]|uniref:Uncharacterized protein n=1 Tax=Ilex paraguariensis TaxID=185542 RepID=A0ABC8U3J5_9AQUA
MGMHSLKNPLTDTIINSEDGLHWPIEVLGIIKTSQLRSLFIFSSYWGIAQSGGHVSKPHVLETRASRVIVLCITYLTHNILGGQPIIMQWSSLPLDKTPCRVSSIECPFVPITPLASASVKRGSHNLRDRNIHKQGKRLYPALRHSNFEPA